MRISLFENDEKDNIRITQTILNTLVKIEIEHNVNIM